MLFLKNEISSIELFFEVWFISEIISNQYLVKKTMFFKE